MRVSVLIFTLLCVCSQATTITIDDILLMNPAFANCTLIGVKCDIMSTLSSTGLSLNDGDSIVFNTTSTLDVYFKNPLTVSSLTFQAASGSVYQFFSNASVLGTIQVTSGNIVQVYGPSWGILYATTISNSAAFVVNNGSQVNFFSGVFVSSDASGSGQGLVVNGGGTVAILGDSIINGSLTLAQSSVFDVISGTVTVSNSLAVSGLVIIGDTLTLVEGASYTQAQGSLDLSSSTAVINSDITINSGAYLIGSGTIIGDLNVMGNCDFVSVNVKGNLALAATSTFKLYLYSATDYKTVTVQGATAVDGSLLINTYYAPAHGDQYNVITSGSLSGAFNIVVGSPINNFAVTYNATTIVALYTGGVVPVATSISSGTSSTSTPTSSSTTGSASAGAVSYGAFTSFFALVFASIVTLL